MRFYLVLMLLGVNGVYSEIPQTAKFEIFVDGSQWEALPPDEPRPRSTASKEYVWFAENPALEDVYLLVEKKGMIFSLKKNGSEWERTVFLNARKIAEKFIGRWTEGGLISMAFHPDFPNNRKYYISLTLMKGMGEKKEDAKGTAAVIELQASVDFMRNSIDEPLTPENIEAHGRVLFETESDIYHDGHHLGLDLNFGPDGYLYLVYGDGGNNVENTETGKDLDYLSQQLDSYWGTMLRIDVDRNMNGKPYGIPSGNPFVNYTNDTLPEIWAWGFRTPHRFSVDRNTGDIFLGDVGAGPSEEINKVVPQKNYGWPNVEGVSVRCKMGSDYCNKTIMTEPIIDLKRILKSVTGGRVYRGNPTSPYFGMYMFTDAKISALWAMRYDGDNLVEWDLAADLSKEIRSKGWVFIHVGEDNEGRLYLVHHNGDVFRLDLDDGATPITKAPDPVIQFFDGPTSNLLRVGMVTSPPGMKIRYTLDGSEPTTQSPLFSSPFDVSQAEKITARAFGDNLDPSNIVEREMPETHRGPVSTNRYAEQAKNIRWQFNGNNLDWKIPFMENAEVRLMDADGKTVKHPIRSGIHFLEVKMGNETIIQKIPIVKGMGQ